MTITKMLKQLQELLQKKGNFIVYKIYDDFLDAFNEVKEGEEKPRITIYLQDIVFQFEQKEGIFFKEFSQSSATFRNKLKWMEEMKEPQKLHPLFVDSKKQYVEKWEKENPGKNYEEEVKKIQEAKSKKAKRSLNHILGMYAGVGGVPYFSLTNPRRRW